MVDFLLAGERIVGIDVTRAQVLEHITRELFVCLVPPRQRLQDDPVTQVLQDKGIQTCALLLAPVAVLIRRGHHLLALIPGH